MYTLTHSKQLYIKDCLIVWSTFLLKVIFLFFHMSPNKYKGAALQPFFMFFLIKDPYQIKSAFLMEECIIHSIKKKSINQLPQDDFSKQWRRMWSIISSSSLHIYHLFDIFNPLLFERIGTWHSFMLGTTNIYLLFAYQKW